MAVKKTRTRRRGRVQRSVGPAGRRRSASKPQSFLKRHTGTLVVVGIVAVVVGLIGFGNFAANLDQARVSDFLISVYQGDAELGGSEVNFQDVLNQGKPIVLNFWAGDCPPCRFEMPAFQRVHEGHPDDVIFLGVDVGVFTGLGTRQSGLALLSELGITYPAGAAQTNRPVVGYGVVAMPTTVFFDAQGNILRRSEGAISEQQLADAVSQILGEG